jgi:hypothetical protein
VSKKVEALREKIAETLRRYGQDAKAVQRPIGRDWLLSELNLKTEVRAE